MSNIYNFDCLYSIINTYIGSHILLMRYPPKYVSLSDIVVLCSWWLKIKKFQKWSWSYSTFCVFGFVNVGFCTVLYAKWATFRLLCTVNETVIFPFMENTIIWWFILWPKNHWLLQILTSLSLVICFCLTHWFVTVLFILLTEMTQHLEIASHLHYIITIVLVYK